MSIGYFILFFLVAAMNMHKMEKWWHCATWIIALAVIAFAGLVDGGRISL